MSSASQHQQQPAQQSAPTFDRAQLAAFLAATLEPAVAAGLGCMEMRLFSAYFNYKTGLVEPSNLASSTLAGWYDKPDALIADAQRLRGVSAYCIANPAQSSMLAASDNKLKKVGKGEATDANKIVAIRWVLIDIDVDYKKCERPKKGSSTDAELAQAIARRDMILDDVTGLSGSSLWGCSGNGGWILARVPDYPNDDEHCGVVEHFIKSLALCYTRTDDRGDIITIDTSTFDSPQLMALPGTMKCKGDPRPDRPYRLATLDSPIGSGKAIEVLDLQKVVEGLPRQAIRKATVLMPGLGSRATVPNLPVNGANRQERPPIPIKRPGHGIYDLEWAIYHCRKVIFDPRFRRSVEGQNGHKDLMHAALTIWNDFGLDDHLGFPLFEEWNRTMADPPEDDGQVRHKWESAKQKHPIPELREYWKIGEGERKQEKQERQQGGRFDQNGQPDRNGDGGGFSGLIIVTTHQNEVVDQAVEAMGSLQEVFQRGNELVRVLRDVSPTKKFIRPPGSPRIALMPKPRLRELMSVAATWRAYSEGGKLIDAHPPVWAIDAMMARGEWTNIRHLEAVIETPVVRKEGTILETPGWDRETTLLYEPEIIFPPMPVGHPSRDEAKAAALKLLEVVSQFPFASPTHSVAWLAALLTPLARFAIDGPCPLFLFDANAPGSGKSLLCDIIAIITTGRTMPRTAYPEGDDEMRKRITAVALAGDRLMMLDNIATTFGGSALDGMLTARTWRDRILGRSEMSSELPLFTVWYGTGNNMALRGDALRRVLPCRLETKDENPENRTEFVHDRIIDWVTKERGRLVAACLTILAAYLLAKMPDKLPPLGSFESWSDVVRSALAWATGIDPCGTRKELTATDSETNIRTALIEGWHQLDWEGSGKTATQALQMIRENPNGYATLYTVAMEISRTENLPSPVSLSRRLRQIKGRVVNGKYLTSTPYQGTMVWKVVALEVNLDVKRTKEQSLDSEGINSRGVGGVSGVDPGTPRDGVVYCCIEGDLVGGGDEPNEPNQPHENDDEASETPF